MKILKTLAAAGIAKKLYSESRKPQNQARVRAGVDSLRDRTMKKGGTRGG
jgi:hypothetical protein